MLAQNWFRTGLVMTLANSIIGVGILAMPFCFQKCGIILATVLLIVSNWITRVCCHYLIKSSLLTRRKSFEFLGFHAFGSSGKLLVELCIIGYLLGTCITYFVVVGDLGPQIVMKMFAYAAGYSHLRTFFMFAVTLFCILPLGMLKNVDSLATVCTASIGFYVCLVIKIILESKAHILANDWSTNVAYWEPAGVLQCLPIFSMALSCQMQLFEVFKSVNNQSVDKLNGIVRDATWICTFVYIAVGFFGYVAFCTQTFSGNILMNFSSSFGSDVIKFGFILSVAFSFPLVIFPCRASIYSLLYRKGHSEAAGGYIPEARFKVITTFIVGFALCVALIIPSVELIIGLVGSTIGVAICIMFPAACFRKIIKKNNNEHRYSLSSFIIASGFCLMVLGTYANLQAIDERSSGVHLEVGEQQKPTDLSLIEQEALQKLSKLSSTENHKFKEENSKLTNKEGFIEVGHPRKVIKEEEQDSAAKNQAPDDSPILPVDEVHMVSKENVQASHSQQNFKLEKIVKHINLSEATYTKPLNAQKQNAKAALEKPQIRVVRTQSIDKDAIKKDEEVAAEESKNENKPNKATEDELKKTQSELKKTKELLERKVDEIKEELAKQNKETQDLVVEKLVEVVEKVEKIEREVEQKNEARKSPEKNKLPATRNLVASAPEIAANAKLPNLAADTPILAAAKVEVQHDKQKTLSNKLTELQQASSNQNPKLDEVYEPLSYKTGELIEQARNVDSVLKQNLPLPLALLVNSSRIMKTKEEGEVVLRKNNTVKNSADVIHRDILELKEMKNVRANYSDPHQRVKREIENTTKAMPKQNESVQKIQGLRYLAEPKLDGLLENGFNDALHFKALAIGRELKSLQNKEN